MRKNGISTLLVHSAFTATARAEQLREQLAGRLEGLAQQLTACLGDLRGGSLPDRLGVCQGAAIEVDRLCGELNVAHAMALEVQESAQEAGLLPYDESDDE
jgi:hypothetical protein